MTTPTTEETVELAREAAQGNDADWEKRLCAGVEAMAANLAEAGRARIAALTEANEWADAIRTVASGCIASPVAARTAIQECKDGWDAARSRCEELERKHRHDLSAWLRQSAENEQLRALIATYERDYPIVAKSRDELRAELDRANSAKNGRIWAVTFATSSMCLEHQEDAKTVSTAEFVDAHHGVCLDCVIRERDEARARCQELEGSLRRLDQRYISAVNGRHEMRRSLLEARSVNEQLRAQLYNKQMVEATAQQEIDKLRTQLDAAQDQAAWATKHLGLVWAALTAGDPNQTLAPDTVLREAQALRTQLVAAQATPASLAEVKRYAVWAQRDESTKPEADPRGDYYLVSDILPILRAAQADTERLDWFESKGFTLKGCIGRFRGTVQEFWECAHGFSPLTTQGKTVREAIDAARASTSAKGGERDGE